MRFIKVYKLIKFCLIMEGDICLSWDERSGWRVFPEEICPDLSSLPKYSYYLCTPLDRNYTELFHLFINLKNRLNRENVIPDEQDPVKSYFR